MLGRIGLLRYLLARRMERKRVEGEGKVKALVDGLSEGEQALLYVYLYNTGWRISWAEEVKRKHFGS